jgi:benzoyl-CoA reductase subunit D
MITAGLDVGSEFIKSVILKDNAITGYSILLSGFELQKTCLEALEIALNKSEINKNEINRLLATGVGNEEAGYKDTVSAVAADARGGVWLFPKVHTIIDVGNEQAWGIHCNNSGKVLAYSRNNKCAAGVGAFVEAMARVLEVPLDELGKLSMAAHHEVTLSSSCAVFAETEVVSLIHSQTDKSDIARAINDSIAVRITAMLQRTGLEQEVLFCGGVANNIGIIERLQHHLKTKLLVPQQPQIVTALGAALIAQDWERSEK